MKYIWIAMKDGEQVLVTDFLYSDVNKVIAVYVKPDLTMNSCPITQLEDVRVAGITPSKTIKYEA